METWRPCAFDCREWARFRLFEVPEKAWQLVKCRGAAGYRNENSLCRPGNHEGGPQSQALLTLQGLAAAKSFQVELVRRRNDRPWARALPGVGI